MCGVPTLPPELRQVTPEAFVATRDALSRRLRQEGDREGAAEVRRLRRPPPPLWALNQLAVVAPDRVSALVQAGEALRATTEAALQGEQAALGRLSSEHARLVDELTGRGMEVLAELPGPGTTETRSRIWTMLRVASLDPDLAPALASGSLAEEPVSTGFDGLLGFELAAQPRPARSGATATAAPEEAAVGEVAEATEVRTRRDRDAELRLAEAQLTHAQADAARRRERRDQARERLLRLRAQLEAAERESEQADRDLATAEEAAGAAEAAVERLRRGGD
jgi:hypothetical protein